MNVILRTITCTAFMLSTVGCQTCSMALKKACGEDACGPEIHVKAPPQKVVVHRDDCPPSEAPCAEEKPNVEAKAPAPQPSAGAGRPAPQPAMVAQGPQQQMPMGG